MPRTLDAKHVKSALRVLEVLEFFNQNRPSASVNDIAKHYDYPQSSTSELMNCLVTLGYLRRAANGRRFAPSSRVATLGSWVQPRLFRHGNVYRLMDELASSTRASAILSSVNYARIQYLHVVADDALDAELALDESPAALLHSAEGHALLSTFPREEAKRLIHRLNSEVDASVRVRLDDMLAELRAVADRGFASHARPDGLSDIAIVLPHAEDGERLVLSLRPTSASISEEEMIRTLSSGFSRYLGLVAIKQAPAQPDALRYAS